MKEIRLSYLIYYLCIVGGILKKKIQAQESKKDRAKTEHIKRHLKGTMGRVCTSLLFALKHGENSVSA